MVLRAFLATHKLKQSIFTGLKQEDLHWSLKLSWLEIENQCDWYEWFRVASQRPIPWTWKFSRFYGEWRL